MQNLEYHKGQICNFKPIMCQEGFCSECLIYQENLSQKNRYLSGQVTTKERERKFGSKQLVTV
jgi:hypothetical protein